MEIEKKNKGMERKAKQQEKKKITVIVTKIPLLLLQLLMVCGIFRVVVIVVAEGIMGI